MCFQHVEQEEAENLGNSCMAAAASLTKLVTIFVQRKAEKLEIATWRWRHRTKLRQCEHYHVEGAPTGLWTLSA